MGIQIAVYFLFIAFFLVYYKKDNKQNWKKFIIICSLILLLKAALRSLSIGSDTSHYAYYFYESINTPWSELLSDFSTRYSKVGGELDAGYYLVQKVFSTFIHDFNLYTFVMQGLFFYWPLGTLIYRNSNSVLQVLFAYTLMNALFMGLPMANARQVYAIGMCIWAFIYLTEKRYVRTVMFIMFGFLFHASALLFALPVVLSLLGSKTIKIISVVAFFLSFVVLTSANTVISFMGNMMEMERYAAYGEGEEQGGAITYIFLSLLLCLFCAFGFGKLKNVPYYSKNWFIMIPLTTFFVPLIYSSGSMIRITMYFQIFFILLVPMTIDILFKNNSRIQIYVTFICILIVMSIYTSGEYIFFWQEDQNPLKYWGRG